MAGQKPPIKQAHFPSALAAATADGTVLRPQSPTNPDGVSPQQLEQFGESLAGNYSVDTGQSIKPDAGFSAALGNSFEIGGDPHVQYYNRHFGYVLRPARVSRAHEPYSPGLHHLCLRVDSVDDVVAVSQALRAAGVDATEAHLHPGYAPDYWATFFTDPDGVRLEVTNYRAERRERHDQWDELGG